MPEPGLQRTDEPPLGDGSLHESSVTDAVMAPGVLSQTVSGALAWSFLNNVVSRVATVLSGILLARLLAPEDYGVFAVALIVLSAVLSMNELGVSLAVVRWEGRVDRIAPTVSTIALVWSVVLYAACYLGAPAIATALNAPEAVTMIRVLSLCVLVDAVSAVPSALITREFLQRRRMIIDLVAFFVGTLLSIALAAGGAGAWSIVWGFGLSNVLAGVLAFVLAPQRFWPGFDREVARELLHFGLPLAASSLVLFLMLNVDYIVVGHELGSLELGLYLMAFNLCSWPVNLVSAAIRRVSFAGFSRIATEYERVGRSFVHSTGLVMALTLPMCAFLAVFATPTIRVLYGEQWLASAGALRALCALGALRVALELVYDYLVAVGRGRINLGLQVLWVAALVPALIIGARADGIVGVAIGHSLVAGLVVLPAALWILHRSHVKVAGLVGALARPVAATVLTIAVGLAVLEAVPGPLLQLVVGGVAVSVACAAVYYPMRFELTSRFRGNATATSGVA